MRKLLLALLFLPAISWADTFFTCSFDPVNGPTASPFPSDPETCYSNFQRYYKTLGATDHCTPVFSDDGWQQNGGGTSWYYTASVTCGRWFSYQGADIGNCHDATVHPCRAGLESDLSLSGEIFSLFSNYTGL